MLEPGQVICDRYQLVEKLNDNPVRQTWLATDLSSRESEAEVAEVIVKLLAVEGSVQWDHVKLFEREAQVLKQLDHPQIPRYRDYFCLDEKPLWFGLVEEYIPGYSLKQLLVQGKKFSEAEIRQIAIALLDTLIYLHELSPPVLHRDIKPSNVIWGEDGEIYLVDFGAVQDKAASEGSTFTVVGTYGYTPLEQFGGRAVAASDLYALGATLIHLVTGVAPAELPQKELRLQFRDRVSLPSALVTWLEILVEPAPENRFGSAAAALEALERGSDNRLTQRDSKAIALQAPLGTKVNLRKTSTELQIEIPARSSAYAVSIFLGLVLLFFALSCFINIGMGSWDWAFAYLLLSLVISFLIYTITCPTQIYFNENCFVIYKQILGYIPSSPDGAIANIEDVFVDHLESKQAAGNSSQRCITLQAGLREYSFGQGLSRAECLWLVQEIRDWLGLR